MAQYQGADDVTVQARADASPWRLKQIKNYLAHMAAGPRQRRTKGTTMNKGNGGFAVMNGETGREARPAMEGRWLSGRILPVGARLPAFLGAGSTAHVGPFRLHMQKLVELLERAAAGAPSEPSRQVIEELVRRARADTAFAEQAVEWSKTLVSWSRRLGPAARAHWKKRMRDLS